MDDRRAKMRCVPRNVGIEERSAHFSRKRSRNAVIAWMVGWMSECNVEADLWAEVPDRNILRMSLKVVTQEEDIISYKILKMKIIERAKPKSFSSKLMSSIVRELHFLFMF